MEDGVAYIHLQMVVSSQVSQDTLMTTPTKHVEPHPRGNGSHVLSREQDLQVSFENTRTTNSTSDSYHRKSEASSPWLTGSHS